MVARDSLGAAAEALDPLRPPRETSDRMETPLPVRGRASVAARDSCTAAVLLRAMGPLEVHFCTRAGSASSHCCRISYTVCAFQRNLAKNNKESLSIHLQSMLPLLTNLLCDLLRFLGDFAPRLHAVRISLKISFCHCCQISYTVCAFIRNLAKNN